MASSYPQNVSVRCLTDVQGEAECNSSSYSRCFHLILFWIIWYYHSPSCVFLWWSWCHPEETVIGSGIPGFSTEHHQPPAREEKRRRKKRREMKRLENSYADKYGYNYYNYYWLKQLWSTLFYVVVWTDSVSVPCSTGPGCPAVVLGNHIHFYIWNKKPNYVLI